MSHLILNRTAKILVVESSGAARQLLTEVVRGSGFESVQGMAQLDDVLTFLETDHCDWIIASLDSNGAAVNALSLMHLCTYHPDLRAIRFNLLVSEAEQPLLSKAFELGLIGWHAKPFTKDSFAASFEEFIQQVEKHRGLEPQIAAESLRPILRQHKQYDDWIAMEKKLLQIYPGEARLLLKLAEPLALKGEVPQSDALIQQAVLLDSDIEKEATALRTTLPPNPNKGTANQDNAKLNVLGLDNIVIVDPDETIQNALRDILNENGVTSIHCFGNGEEAAKFIKEQPGPGLIIHEWRLPGLSGPMFIQRIINEGAATTPVILLSSLVQANDSSLLKEMGIATVVPKPFDKTDFLKSLIWTLQQDRCPSDQGVIESKIRQLLKAGKKQEASPLVAKFIDNPQVPAARRKQIEAEWAYTHKEYERARDAGLEALKGANDSVHALNILGKAFMQLREFASALKCLQKAQVISPKNIERLCYIAESQTELGEVSAAQDALQSAQSMDNGAQQVAEARVKVAMTNGDVKSAKTMMSSLEQLESIVAYMNNKAVALARCQQFEESIQQYHKTIEALPEDQQKLKSLVYYNLALALARAAELDDSLKYIELALQHPHRKIKSKAISIKERLVQAINSGSDFRLRSSKSNELPADAVTNAEAPSGTTAVTHDALLNVVTTQPGEIGCFLIYTPLADLPGQEAITPLKFERREGIAREETMKGGKPIKIA